MHLDDGSGDRQPQSHVFGVPLPAGGIEGLQTETQGDHLVYSYPGAMRPVVIPKYEEVPAFIIKNNMKVIGMTRDQYFQFLENI